MKAKLTATGVLLMFIMLMYCAKPADTPGRTSSPSRGLGEPLAVPLCDIVANPGAYDGMRVTVIGCVRTDGRHYVVLSRAEKSCVDGGLVPLYSPRLRAADRFDPQPGKQVCGTFSGTFRASDVLYQRVLEVEKTANLQTSAWDLP